MTRPTVSVCVATYKRAEGLIRLLDSLARQKLPPEIGVEIVVVDNDAAGSAKSIVEARSDSQPTLPLDYLVEPRQNIAHARNRAVEHARGEWLLFIDDDEVADEDWVGSYLGLFDRETCDGAFGPVLPVIERRVTPWIDPEAFYTRPRHTSGTRVPPGELRTSNAAVRRASLGGARFDPAYGKTGGSDAELFGRLRDAGAHFLWCDEALVVEFVAAERHSARWLAQRAFRGGCVHARIAAQRDPAGCGRRAVRSAGMAIACVALAPVAALAGRPTLLRVALRVCTQAGHLWSWWGRSYEEYRER